MKLVLSKKFHEKPITKRLLAVFRRSASVSKQKTLAPEETSFAFDFWSPMQKTPHHLLGKRSTILPVELANGLLIKHKITRHTMEYYYWPNPSDMNP